MLRNRSRRLATVAVLLACWVTPATQAIGVGLHVALESGHGWDGSHDHDGPQGHARSRDQGDESGGLGVPTTLDAEHEHRHVLAAPDPGPPGVRPAAPAGVDEALSAAPSWCETEAAPPFVGFASHDAGPSQRPGSPAPLFYAHCSLLR